MIRISLLLAALALLQPQPDPADLYHQGARAYVDGDNARALDAVNLGLAQAPDDARLQALRDLIQQQQDEEDDEDGGQQDEAENSDPGDQGEDGDDGQDGQQGDDGQNDGQQGQDEGSADADATNTDPADPTQSGQAPPGAAQPGRMTQAQAQRILDAVGGEERLLLRELRRAPTQGRRSDKDW